MISVTCAVIRNEDEKVLIVQHGETTDHPLKWEFPGGKILPGESGEECIIREVQEELAIDIVICGNLPEVEYDYGIKRIRLIPFICDTLDEKPSLSEHIAYKWISAADLGSIDFSEADLHVVRSYLASIEDEKISDMPSTAETEMAFLNDDGIRSMINNMISLKEVDWLAVSATENEAILNKLLEYSFSPDKKLAFRASWTLTKVYDKDPDIIYPFLSRIVGTINKLDNESVLRSFLRIISISDVDKISNKHHGILADYCFSALNSKLSAIAVKAYSMEILFNLAMKYPELTDELSASIKMVQGEGSAGILARGRIIQKKLSEKPIGPKSGKTKL